MASDASERMDAIERSLSNIDRRLVGVERAKEISMSEPITPAPIQTVESLLTPPVILPPTVSPVVVPADMPPTDPKVPLSQKIQVTPEQWNFLLNTAIPFVASLLAHWPKASGLAAAILAVGGAIGYYVHPVAVPPSSIVESADVSPIVKPAAKKMNLVLYTTDRTHTAAILADPAIKALPVNVKVDGKVYNAGLVYKMPNGNEVQLPCVVFNDVDGKMIAVQPFSTADDIVRFVEKNAPKTKGDAK